MYKIRSLALALFALLSLTANKSMAAAGDTTVAHVYQDEVIVTNPGQGFNNYYKWGEFPAATQTYSKVIMYLTFQCPNTMGCAEWDYLDPISIGRTGGVNGTNLDWEFARFITPYGNSWSANSSFKHGWYYDVTDFASLLHDSVEIIYNHTGYEANTRGWKINMTFYFIEGTPDRDIKNITRIYQGGYGYDANIETNLSAQSITYGANTNEARVKIIQSGHGMNDQNCSEFCPKQRWVKYDADTINDRIMWRECGFNSLFPQAGTWLYDRGNWCPGASVKYDDIDIHGVTPGTAHTFDIDMEAATGNFGTQAITAYVIEYGSPNYTTDVSLENIIAPSNEYEASRMNPICSEPVIVIKNNGTAPLTSLDIVYGVPGGTQGTYNWTGNLAYLAVDTVRITQAVNWTPGSNTFQVQLQNPNNGTDQNIHNDFSVSAFTNPPVVNTDKMQIYFRTNNAPTENRYRLMDMTTGSIVSQKSNFTVALQDNRDTVELISGHCYSFEFYDDGPPPSLNPLNNDGLNWWANPDDGAGVLRFMPMVTAIPIKNFATDFGTKILYQFMCRFPLAISGTETKDISVIVSPNPSTDGIFNVDYSLPGDRATLEVYNMVGMKVSSKELNNKNGQATVSLKDMSKGIYLIKILTADKLVNTQKVIYQ
jgi:hypothetical protein